MTLVGCSLRLPVGEADTGDVAVVVHQVVDYVEKLRGGGELTSCRHLWRTTARIRSVGRANGWHEVGRAWSHCGRLRCRCCGSTWGSGISLRGSNPFAA